MAERLHLLVYSDLSYRRDENGLSSVTPSFVAWLAALAAELDELTVLGRVDSTPGRAAFPLHWASNMSFVELPHYENLRHLPQVARAIPRSSREFSRAVRECDAALLFGPHPIAAIFGAIARRHRIPVFVGVRENLVDYLPHRVTGWRRRLARPAASALQAVHVALGRSGGAVVVGSEMAGRYRDALGDRVLETGISLVPAADLVPEEVVERRPWPGDRVIAVVERLDPDKNPLLLLDVASRLCPKGWTIEVAGTGLLAGELASKSRARGLSSGLCLLGRLDRDALRRLYARATLFLHVSLTEGQPQVLYEAASAGLPIIATAVGGVGSALRGGERGLLVPPRDAEAIEAAVDLLDEPDLRASLVRAAWGWAKEDTLESQVRRVAAFLSSRTASAAACSGDGPKGATDNA